MRKSQRLAAACLILVPTAVFAPSALAQEGGAPTSTLDLTLNTGKNAPPPAEKKAPPVSRAAGPRFQARAGGSSRGQFERSPNGQQPQVVVLGKLAIVTSDRAEIRRERDRSSRLLSAVPQGTNLAIVSESGDYYGILMIDKSTGWVSKSQVRLIEYQVAVGDPSAAVPPIPEPPSSSSPSAGHINSADLPPDVDPRAYALLQEAFSYLGVPYVWAGNTRSGLDCSGFVKNVFAAQGMKLPRHSGDQAKVGMPVNWEDLRPGDRLYFDMGNKGRISHTGIYIGGKDMLFIHASSNQGKVGVDSLLKPNYYKGLVCARR